MGSRQPQQYYCRCGTRLAKDNTGSQCARCERASRDKLIAPPEVPVEFWQTEQFREAFAAQHIGRIARAYRTHHYHHAAHGPGGISQTLLGQWLGLRQPQVSRVETGAPIRNLDTLGYWARTLSIPAELLWFLLPREKGELVASATSDVLELRATPPSNGVQPGAGTNDKLTDNPEHDPVLVAPWSPRGTLDVAVVLRGGDGLVERRGLLFLTGAVLTAPAHQWLVHEPEPLVSALAGRQVPGGVVDRLPAMIAELRTMDDVAGGGNVLTLAQYHFGWVAGLLDQASYDDATGRKLYSALAELGQLVGWVYYDTGQHGLAQRYYVAALRAAHAAGDRPLGAHILGLIAYQAAHRGRPAEAVTLIDTAVAGTRGQQTPRLLTELYIRKAYAFAALKDASACTTAISQARTHVEQPTSDDDPPYLYWVRPAEITTGAGECLLQLGHADQAAAVLDQGIAMFDESFDRDKQYYLTYLVEALARPGKQRDLDIAAGKGIEAIRLVESVSSARNVDRIRGLTRLLTPHAGVPAVREFLEQARAFLDK